MNRIQILSALVLVLISLASFGQTLKPEKVQANWIFNIASVSDWENEDQYEKFRIGIIGYSPVIDELKNLASQRKLKDKDVEVIIFKKVKDIKNIHILYVDIDRNESIKQIYEQIEENGVLLITDRCEKKQYIMINFLSLEAKAKQFEVNKQNIEKENIDISPKVLLQGGSILDLRNIYRESEQRLKDEQEKVEQARNQIKKQKKEIAKQQKEIEEQAFAIKKQTQRLNEQKAEIILQQTKLDDQKQKLEQQQNKLSEIVDEVKQKQAALREKMEVLSQQEVKIEAQQDEIKEHNKVLSQQKDAIKEQQARIDNQKKTLTEQDTTIETQKGIIYIVIAFLAVVAVLAFFIYRGYKIKKKINKQLEEKNDAITRQKEQIETQKNQIEAAYDNVHTLSEIGKEITANLEVGKIISTVYEHINTLMNAAIFTIGRYDEIKNRIEFEGTKENGKTLPTYFYELTNDSRLAVWTYKNNKEVLINNFCEEYMKYIPNIAKPKAGESPMSLIYMPLSVKEKTIGVISVQSFEENAYNENHLNMVRNIAVYAAIALDNAEAYRHIDEQATSLREANVQLEEQQEEIQQQAEELAAQADALEISNEALQREKEYTMGSIRYAKTIQEAILPTHEQISPYFEHFVVYRPKDIVSGDFYWFYAKPETNTIFAAAIDCTGHGVPGAFMSMIGNRVLNELIIEKNYIKPGEILNAVDENIKFALKQDKSDNKDGMDICLCRIDNFRKKQNGEYKLTFAGAKRSLFYFSHSEGNINRLKGTVRSIGGVRPVRHVQPYVEHKIAIKKHDVIYLTTDGMVDQNGPDRRRFGTDRFLQLLQDVSGMKAGEQKAHIEKALDNHQKGEKQRDDITIFGLMV